MIILSKIWNKIVHWYYKLTVEVKTEEVKISDDVDLWSHRMIDSLIRDIDILRQRIQKLEQDMRNKK